MQDVDIPTLWIAPFLLTLARVGGVMTFAPFFGSASTFAAARVIAAFSITYLVFPVVQDRVPEPPTELVGLALLLIGELLIGLLLGLVGKLVLTSLEVAGQVMGFQMGFSFIQAVDPQTSVQAPFLSILMAMIGTFLLLLMNGHHWFLVALVNSYELGAGFSEVSTGMLEQLLVSSGQMFVVGFQMAAPFVVLLILTDLLLGIIGRTAPQLMILILGLPAKILIGLILMMSTFHTFIPLVGEYIGEMRDQLGQYLALLAG